MASREASRSGLNIGLKAKVNAQSTMCPAGDNDPEINSKTDKKSYTKRVMPYIGLHKHNYTSD